MTPYGHIDFDSSLWPLLLVRHKGLLTNQMISEALETRTRYLERCEPSIVVYDLTHANELVSIEQRRMQNEWTKAHDAQLRQWVLGVGIVTTSVTLRLLVNLAIRFKPLSMPHQVFARMPEAAIWSAGLLQRAGLKSHHILAHYTGGASPHAP